MSLLQAMCGVALVPLAVYVLVRVSTAAYYQSKRQYERMTNGTQKP